MLFSKFFEAKSLKKMLIESFQQIHSKIIWNTCDSRKERVDTNKPAKPYGLGGG